MTHGARYQHIQKEAHKLLNADTHESLASFRLKIVLAALTVLAVTVVMLDSFSAMPPWWRRLSFDLNLFITLFFSIEYLLRLWVAPLRFPTLPAWRARLRHMRKPAALIDLVAVLPFYLMVLTHLDVTGLRMLWILRLFVLLKFNRYFHTLDNILSVMKHKRWELISSLLAVGSLMLISSALIYTMENPVQPDKFKNIFSGLWWAISTLLTIGYGDIYPVTDAGKLLASVVAILGVGLIAVPTGIISAGYVEEMQDRQNKHRKAYNALKAGTPPQKNTTTSHAPTPKKTTTKARTPAIHKKRTPKIRHYSKKKGAPK